VLNPVNGNEGDKVVELAAELTIAWLQNAGSDVRADEVPAFLQRVHRSLKDLIQHPEASEDGEKNGRRAGAVSVRKSLADPNVIVSMIDGQGYKSLKRHIAKHGFTPEEYRRHFNLPPDYPMVSRAYSSRRRELAQAHGFKKPAERGRKASGRRS
jgi:predicted transcriptional regulator